MQNKLQKLISLCNCGISININQHKNLYQGVKEHIIERYIDDVETAPYDSEGNFDFSVEPYKSIVEKNQLIDLHFYPNTPVGFYQLIGSDLDELLDQALELLKE